MVTLPRCGAAATGSFFFSVCENFGAAPNTVVILPRSLRACYQPGQARFMVLVKTMQQV